VRTNRARLVKLGAVLIAIGAAWLSLVIAAGAKLIVENKSGHDISDVRITYKGGEVSVPVILKGHSMRESLGMIGEGNYFAIQWKDDSGKTHEAQFTVYFEPNGLLPYNTLRIEFRGKETAVFFDGKSEINEQLANSGRVN
jgi:hypothetical protein